MKKIRGVYVPDYETKFGNNENDPPYQQAKYQAALKYCTRRRRAVDVGAHVGSWTLQMLEHFEKVTAFEPDHEKWACFDLNVPNQRDGRVELWRMALGARTCQVSLVDKPGTSLKTKVSMKAGGTIQMTTLDRFALTQVDLLKIDCEGYEYFVVRGGHHTITHERPVIIVEQKPNVSSRYYGVDDLAAVDLLRTWGYRVKEAINGDYVMVPR